MKKILFLSFLCTTIFSRIPLFEAYPRLGSKVPHIDLCSKPSIILECKELVKQLNCKKLYLKNDGMINGKKASSDFFGGNKVRKLEFLLADALKKESQTVITFGCIGSNHALATACCCKELDLKCLLMLKSQPNSPTVRRNLLLDLYFGAKLYYFPTEELRSIGAKYKIFKQFEKDGVKPYVIPTGGSNPLGILGFVNAAFELKQQINAGLMPEPDYIYVPVGSGGTTVGLMIGLSVAGLKSKVIPVGVEPNAYDAEIQNMFSETLKYIRKIDSSFPEIEITNLEKTNMAAVGLEYGDITEESENAVKTMCLAEDIFLEHTYSGKALAALTSDSNSGKLKDKVVLFWNTFCSKDFDKQLKSVDYKLLPHSLQRYF